MRGKITTQSSNSEVKERGKNLQNNLVIVLICQGCYNEIPQTRGLTQKSNKNFFHSSEGVWMSKIELLTGLISLEVSLLGLPTAASSLCAHMVFSLCMHIPDPSSSSSKQTSYIGLRPHFL